MHKYVAPVRGKCAPSPLVDHSPRPCHADTRQLITRAGCNHLDDHFTPIDNKRQTKKHLFGLDHGPTKGIICPVLYDREHDRPFPQDETQTTKLVVVVWRPTALNTSTTGNTFYRRSCTNSGYPDATQHCALGRLGQHCANIIHLSGPNSGRLAQFTLGGHLTTA